MSIGNIIKHIEPSGVRSIPYSFSHCPEMSLKARGLYVSIMMLPDGWDLSLAGLQAILPDGRDSISSAMNELITIGYLKREPITDERGRKAGYRYHVYSTPTATGSVPGKGYLEMEKPVSDYLKTENQIQNSDINNNSKNITLTHSDSPELAELRRFVEAKCPVCFERFVFFDDAQVKWISNHYNKQDIARILTDIELKACGYHHGASFFKLFERFAYCDYKLNQKNR